MGFLEKLTPSKLLGNKGEAAAERYLKQQGYRVLDRNWRYRQWELDLVCRDGDTAVFAEVKTRGTETMGTPADGLNHAKQARLVKAASHYLSKKDLWDEPCRFDLVAVTETDGDLAIDHIENAFDLTGMNI